VRAVSVDPEAIVVTSLLWRTTATAIRAGEEAMLIDSPYFPDELELLASVLGQSGFEPSALLATHGDFDHLLGRLAFPELALGVAQETALRLRETVATRLALAEVGLAMKEPTVARTNAARVLELDPANERAKAILRAVSGG